MERKVVQPNRIFKPDSVNQIWFLTGPAWHRFKYFNSGLKPKECQCFVSSALQDSPKQTSLCLDHPPALASEPSASPLCLRAHFASKRMYHIYLPRCLHALPFVIVSRVLLLNVHIGSCFQVGTRNCQVVCYQRQHKHWILGPPRTVLRSEFRALTLTAKLCSS